LEYILIKLFIKISKIPSEGASNPASVIALLISGFSKKSLKPVEWIPT
jgi:hypothetical protein